MNLYGISIGIVLILIAIILGYLGRHKGLKVFYWIIGIPYPPALKLRTPPSMFLGELLIYFGIFCIILGLVV